MSLTRLLLLSKQFTVRLFALPLHFLLDHTVNIERMVNTTSLLSFTAVLLSLHVAYHNGERLVNCESSVRDFMPGDCQTNNFQY